MKRDVATLILAAGWGTRMKSNTPKVLHKIAHKPVLSWVLGAAETMNPSQKIVVIRPGMDMVKEATGSAEIVLQVTGEGTGAAVLAARQQLENFKGDILILFGDTPFISPETLKCLLEIRHSKLDPAVVVLGFRPEDPAEYGRIVLDQKNMIERIVEYKDASPHERDIQLCNSGVMAVKGEHLFELLDQVTPNNAKNELYLTDIIDIAKRKGLSCAVIEADESEVMGINSRADLARAEMEAQMRLRGAALAMGVTLIDPDSIYLSADTHLGKDITIWPQVVIMPGVKIEDQATIYSFCHLQETHVKKGASIGPFARLRPGANIGENVKIGNFVEVKNSTFDRDAKASHLSYIGDSLVGEGTNIGAGTITCNYDGIKKGTTTLGKNVFIGSNSALVAPLKIGDGAIIGAGSVITEEVPEDALAIGRGRQVIKEKGAARYREKNQKERGVLKTVIDNGRS